MIARLLATPLIVATGALLVAPPADAAATYDLVLAGLVEHTVDCWESVPLCSGPPTISYPWIGTLAVVLDSSADGTYTDAAFESLTLASNIAGGHWDTGFTVTVEAHQVSAVAGFLPLMTPHDEQAFIVFDGLDADFSGSGMHHYGPTTASGSLSAVPEARAYLSMLFGLAALASVALGRRGQACIKGQRGFTSNA